MGRLTGVLGIAVILALAYLFSTDRRAIKLKTVAWGLGLQFALGLFVLRVRSGQALFGALGAAAKHLLDFSYVGSTFVFGELGKSDSNLGLIFAFQVLPTIIFIAAFFAVLYHLGIMQLILRAGAWGMTTVMGASGAEPLTTAASIFMGQTESPLTIRPFLSELTQSELMTVMTSGMAHISGGMMAAYILFGIEAKHLLTAVIMTAPGTIMMAKMLVPETEVPKTMGSVKLEIEQTDVNVIDAAGRGTGEGLQLVMNVGAMLISFLALIAMVNYILGFVHLSLQQIFGLVFAPVAWSMGVPWR